MLAVDIFYTLLDNMWKEETIAKDWLKEILIKLTKRRNFANIDNWRSITLLSTASKVMTRPIPERLKDAVDNKLRENLRLRGSCV